MNKRMNVAPGDTSWGERALKNVGPARARGSYSWVSVFEVQVQVHGLGSQLAEPNYPRGWQRIYQLAWNCFTSPVGTSESHGSRRQCTDVWAVLPATRALLIPRRARMGQDQLPGQPDLPGKGLDACSLLTKEVLTGSLRSLRPIRKPALLGSWGSLDPS